MARKTPLTEEEKRYLNALKFFMQRNEDPEHLEDRIVLDELSPEKARAMIVLHHIWLEDQPLFFSAYKLSMWISPIVDVWVHVKDIFIAVKCGRA